MVRLCGAFVCFSMVLGLMVFFPGGQMVGVCVCFMHAVVDVVPLCLR